MTAKTTLARMCALGLFLTMTVAAAAVSSKEAALLALAAQAERSLISPQWLADSRRLVVDDMSGGQVPRLDLLDSETGRKTLLAYGQFAAPAPQGALVAYLNKEGGIEVRDADSGRVVRTASIDAAYQLATNWGEGAVFGWTPTGRSFVYVLEPRQDVKQPPPHRVMSLDVDSGRSALLFEQADPVLSAQYFGKEIVVELASPLWTDGEIAIISDGKVRTRLRGQGQQFLMPQVGPGNRIAFLQDTLGQTVVGSKNLAVWEPDNGKVRVLSRGIFVTWQPPRWIDQESVIALCKRGPFASTFCAEGATSVRVETDPLENIMHWSLSPDGRQLAWRSLKHDGSQRVWLANSDGTGKKALETHTSAAAANFTLGNVRVLHWKSHDGLELAGLLIVPQQRRRGATPLLVDLHGGPMGGIEMSGQILNASPLEWHYWADRGYAVFVADYRSSLLYGTEAYLKMRGRGDLSTDDMQDVLTGVDAAIAAAELDPSRVAVIGHSAGSCLVNYMITRTNRFTVAVTKEGSSDWRTAYADNDDAGRRYQHWRFGGSPAEVAERYERNSPITQARRVKTPVYVMAASCCAGTELEIFAQEIERGGAAVKYRLFDDAHVFVKPENQREALYEAVSWIDKYINPPSETASGK